MHGIWDSADFPEQFDACMGSIYLNNFSSRRVCSC